MGGFHGPDGEEMPLPDDFEGFAIPVGQLRDGVVISEMIEILESMKNMMERVEHDMVHALLLNHDGLEESDEYFEGIAERVEMDKDDGIDFWSTAKLRTLYALRDAATNVCQRYAVTAGANPEELDNGIPD